MHSIYTVCSMTSLSSLHVHRFCDVGVVGVIKPYRLCVQICRWWVVFCYNCGGPSRKTQVGSVDVVQFRPTRFIGPDKVRCTHYMHCVHVCVDVRCLCKHTPLRVGWMSSISLY